MDARQVGVVVPRMRHQFPCAVRELFQKGEEGRSIENPSTGYGDRAVGGREALLRHNSATGRFEPAQRTHLRQAEPGRTVRRTDGPRGFKGIADGADAARTCGAKDRPENGRKDVRVLMRVDVSETDALALEELDLRAGFNLNLHLKCFSPWLSIQAVEKIPKAAPETVASGIGKVGNLISSGEQRRSIDEHNVAPYSKGRRRTGDLDGFVCRKGPSHQSRARNKPVRVELADGAVHA
jgi:hypothetical protein